MSAAGDVLAALQPAVLTVINPSGQRSRAVVNQTPFQIGRQADNQLVLRDNRVSRVHAQIVAQDGGYFIEDLNSRHGVYINGDRIEGKKKLTNSDTVTFGFGDGYQLVFVQEEREIGKLADHVANTARSSLAVGGNLAKLRALVEVARAMQSALSIQEVLESVVDAAITVTATHRGFLLMKHGSELRVDVARDANGARLSANDLKVPTHLIRHALEHRRELLSMNFDPMSGVVDPDTSFARLELRSAVCVPLIRIKTAVSTQTIASPISESVGLIYLDSKVDVADLSSGNREILQTLALEASTVLENARLLEQERAKQRLEEELRIAREIQQTLLPSSLPATGWLRMAGSSIASQQVGGDYYDAAELSADTWFFIVADVSGKGVSSALLASLLQGAFLAGSGDPDRIRELLGRINRYLYERAEGEKYATLVYCAIHRDGTAYWANAGHCPPMLVHADGSIETWRPTAMPVGILDITEFSVHSTLLRAGDRIVVFSDGITEAQNDAGEFFEQRRIRTVLEQNPTAGAGELHAKLLAAVHAFTGGVEQRDDMTLVIAEYCPD